MGGRALFLAGQDGEDRLLLSERIRNVLTDEITSGVLAASANLDEQQIADRFGVSRTPVREALRQLAVGGLVETRPHRGVVVTSITPDRVMEMFEAMAEVEALCARLATYRMSPFERSRVTELHEGSHDLIEAGDLDGYDAFNREFHEALYRATHNAFLVEQAIQLRSRLNAFRRTQLRYGDRVTRSHHEHDGILTAISHGDGDEAAKRMRAHMLNAATALGRYLSAQTALGT